MHGANYKSLYERFQLEVPETVYDLSENVNFLGAPPAIKTVWPALLETISSYPHPEAEPLRSTLAQTHNVSSNHILVGNGAAELLTFFANRFSGKRVIILHPTFSEYKLTLDAAGAEVVELVIEDLHNYQLPLSAIKEAMKDASCIYFCNPNNPTGALISKTILEELIRYGEQVNCEIVVDEAFMDWTDEKNSVIPIVPRHNHVTVFRSMTKMYGIAGVRLGYLVGSPQLVEQLENKLPHWHVNQLAIELGEICLQDESFRLESIRKSNEIKQDITLFLEQHDCIVLKSAANFLCFQLKKYEQTREFYFHCLKRGVVLRHTENYEGLNGQWLRIGMKDHAAMEAFKLCIDEWCK